MCLFPVREAGPRKRGPGARGHALQSQRPRRGGQVSTWRRLFPGQPGFGDWARVLASRAGAPLCGPLELAQGLGS